MIDLKSWPDNDAFRAAINKTPYYKTIAMELMKLDKKGAVVIVKSSRRHRNVWGTVHGGAVASLVDSTSGLSVVPHLKDGETIMTISLQVDYFAPVVKGDVTARGKVVHRGKRLARAEAVIEDEQKNLIAKGHAMYMIFSANNDDPSKARRLR
jgi:uncharacterized protein (TIGR00369 family)